jgi:hypothetical protein
VQGDASAWSQTGHAVAVEDLVGRAQARDSEAIGDGALFVAAEDALDGDLVGGGAKGGFEIGGGDGEALVVLVQEGRQEPVAVFERASSGEAEFDGQATLEGLPKPFDASLCLGGEGLDVADLKLMEGAAILSEGRGMTSEFLFDGELVVVGNEDGVLIGVHEQGEAMSLGHLAGNLEVALKIFVGSKHGRHDLAGGIVDEALKATTGTTLFKPGIRTSVAQDELAEPGPPRS